MVDAWHSFLSNKKLRRFSVLVLLIAVLFLIKSMLSMLLLTFVFTYLIVHFVRFVHKYTKIPNSILVIITYIVIIWGMYVGIVNYLPQLVNQIIKMTNSLVQFYNQQNTTDFYKFVNKYVSISSINEQVKKGVSLAFNYVTSIGSMGVTFFFSFVLSFFYAVELKQLNHFAQNFKTGDFAWFFNDIEYFGRKFVNTFGVVIGAQFSIAIANTIITTICLIFMDMPQILTLSLMIFIFSLVPVAGVIVSSIPLSIIAYSDGGFKQVAYIIIMIIIVHAIETYLLNPQFMASRTELPVFYTFIVLMLGEHFFGVWGLIVGVPIFVFFLDLLDVKRIGDNKQPVKVKKLE